VTIIIIKQVLFYVNGYNNLFKKTYQINLDFRKICDIIVK